jgi:Predicted integral membrane protein (DUF2189)
MIAAGLYETSRRLEKSEPVSLASTLHAGFFGGGQLACMGLLLMLIYLAWVEIALLLFMLFLGPEPMPPLEAFVSNLLLTLPGLGLLIVGTGVGMALAATVFAVSAAAADDRACRCRYGGADERQGLPQESEGHGALGSADRRRDAVRLRDAFLRPCDRVPIDRSRDLACLPRYGRARRRILSRTVGPVCENSIHFRNAVKASAMGYLCVRQ